MPAALTGVLLWLCVVLSQVIESGGVSWDDIAGLETAKALIKEIVVWPMLNPQLFTVRAPCTPAAAAASQPSPWPACWRLLHLRQ